MAAKRKILSTMIALLLAALISPSIASADLASPKTRVMGSDLAAEHCIWGSTALSPRTHQGIEHAYGEITSGSVVAARGLPAASRIAGFPALEAKFGKHAAEWGAGNITKLGYAKRAETLINSPIGGNIQGITRQSGEILRYNVRTNELAIANADGTIATMFRPVEGLQYWLQQLVP